MEPKSQVNRMQALFADGKKLCFTGCLILPRVLSWRVAAFAAVKNRL
jgi:hypothetical protein